MGFIYDSIYNTIKSVLKKNKIKYNTLVVDWLINRNHLELNIQVDDTIIHIDNINISKKELTELIIDSCITEVIFRKEYDGLEYVGVVAIFPYLIERDYNMTCYAHIGQHSTCTYEYYLSTNPCNNPDDYKKLYDELTSIGYTNLKVIKRIDRNKQNYIKDYNDKNI